MKRRTQDGTDEMVSLADMAEPAPVTTVRASVTAPTPAPTPTPTPTPVRPAPTPARDPWADLTREERSLLTRRRLKAVLDVPRQRGSRPTLVTYTRSGQRCSVLVDVGPPIMEEAWALWKELMGADPDGFLCVLHELTSSEIPRLYVGVEPMELS